MMRCVLLVAVAAAVVGCHCPTGPLEYDSPAAREALVAALEAWKKGPAADLPRRSPPIRFLDDDLAAGFQLVDYQLPNSDATLRPFEGVPVVLRLRDRSGKVVERTVQYQVTLQPVVAVLRADL